MARPRSVNQTQALHLKGVTTGPLFVSEWTLEPHQQWVVLGGIASGKSHLAQALCSYSGGLRVEWLSLEQQQALYERELARDETDYTDIPDPGTSVANLLSEVSNDAQQCTALAEQLGLGALLQRGYRLLSTGECRRVMLARALLQAPDLLCLEEPFEGLDQATTVHIKHVLAHYAQAGQRMVLLLSQRQDIPDWTTHWALLAAGQLATAGPVAEVQQHPSWQAWAAPSSDQSITLPPRQSKFQLPQWPDDEPLVELKNGQVTYGDRTQFSGLDWSLWPGQHTQLLGPNGCGKSTLLKLVTGDHPQCYSNDLSVLGYRRGQGESIWDIKKHLGIMSGDLVRDYRVSGNVITAVISGLTDSIGLYQTTGAHERDLAMQWLSIMGLSEQALKPLRSLSSGEQRLVLLARALIKQPPLLVLDEPTSGLDDWHRFRFLRMVEQLLASGPTTLLWVSHRADEQLAVLKHQLIFTPADEGWQIQSLDLTSAEQMTRYTSAPHQS